MGERGKKKPDKKEAKDQPTGPALAPPPKGAVAAGPLVFTPPALSEGESSVDTAEKKTEGKAKKDAPAAHSDRPKSLAERRQQAEVLQPARGSGSQRRGAAAASRGRAGESRDAGRGRRRQRKPKTGLWLGFGVCLLIAWLAFHPKFRAALAPYLESNAATPDLHGPEAEAARLLTALGLGAEGAAADLESAIRQFQEMAGLTADGKVSDSLLEELRAVSGLLGEAASEESLP